jgi:hypothetical protein
MLLLFGQTKSMNEMHGISRSGDLNLGTDGVADYREKWSGSWWPRSV